MDSEIAVKAIALRSVLESNYITKGGQNYLAPIHNMHLTTFMCKDLIWVQDLVQRNLLSPHFLVEFLVPIPLSAKPMGWGGVGE